MALQEDDNKLRFNTNVNSDREVNIINVYKRLEFVLNNKNESFPNKVESLVQVWKQVSQCHLTEHKQYVVHLMDWLKLHTLNIVLTGDWKKFKDVYEEKLLKEVKHCEMLLLHSNNIFSLRCRKLAEIIKDPWGSPILNRLLNDPDVVIGPQEIEFFCIETGYLISTRLRKLCESHCEDLALNLVSTFMRCHQMAETQHFTLNATEDQKRFILDVYIALLYKYKKTSLIISTLKSLSLKEGLDLLKRFAHKRVNISKIWRHSNRIAHLAAQVYITATVLKPPEESVTILESLLETWFSLNESAENLESLLSAVRRIIQPAESAVHLYIFCEAFHKKFGPAMKTFTIELYIRALTTGMNELERQKNEDDAAKVTETTQQLALGFLRLAEVLEENVKVSRECVLTSFSLQPTEETLEKIVKLAERSGYSVLDTGQDWKCKLHPPIHKTDDLCWKCDVCGEYMSQPQFEAPLNTNTALNEALTAEQLGLSSQLCDDLVVVLSSPRYQLFNWLLHWDDLHRLCVLYLNNPEGTKNLVTELKFLDIDYSIFVGMKREPEDEELTGIERGYEHYLEDELYTEERISTNSEDSISQDSRPYSLGSDGMGDHTSLLPLPSSGKSDPNVLKSLRLFRPNLKRSKVTQESVLPPKVFVTSESVSPLATGQTTISSSQYNMGNVNGLSKFMDKYVDGYNLLPKPFQASSTVSPHTTAKPTFSTVRHTTRQDDFQALLDKYLGYDTSRTTPSNHPSSSSSSTSLVNWDMLGQCSSGSSGRSNIKNSHNSKAENHLNKSKKEGHKFLVSNSDVRQDKQCSANSSSVDNYDVEPRKQSMKQMFSEMEQALLYLKQQKNVTVLDMPVTENRYRNSLNLTKENSNQQNVNRTSNEFVAGPSRRSEPSSTVSGESHLTKDYSGMLGNIGTVPQDNGALNYVKHNRGEESKLQNFLLDYKSSDSPEKRSGILDKKFSVRSGSVEQKDCVVSVTKLSTSVQAKSAKNIPGTCTFSNKPTESNNGLTIDCTNSDSFGKKQSINLDKLEKQDLTDFNSSGKRSCIGSSDSEKIKSILDNRLKRSHSSADDLMKKVTTNLVSPKKIKSSASSDSTGKRTSEVSVSTTSNSTVKKSTTKSSEKKNYTDLKKLMERIISEKTKSALDSKLRRNTDSVARSSCPSSSNTNEATSRTISSSVLDSKLKRNTDSSPQKSFPNLINPHEIVVDSHALDSNLKANADSVAENSGPNSSNTNEATSTSTCASTTLDYNIKRDADNSAQTSETTPVSSILGSRLESSCPNSSNTNEATSTITCVSTVLDDNRKKDADNLAEKGETTPTSSALGSRLKSSCPNSSNTNEASSTSTCASTTFDDNRKKDADNSAEKIETTPTSSALGSRLKNSCPNSSNTNEASSTSTCASTTFDDNRKKDADNLAEKGETTPTSTALGSRLKNSCPNSSNTNEASSTSTCVSTALQDKVKRDADNSAQKSETTPVGSDLGSRFKSSCSNSSNTNEDTSTIACASTALDNKLKKDADKSAQKSETTPVCSDLGSRLESSCPNSSNTNEASSTSTCVSTALQDKVKRNADNSAQKSETTPASSDLGSTVKSSCSNSSNTNEASSTSTCASTTLDDKLKKDADNSAEKSETTSVGSALGSTIKSICPNSSNTNEASSTSTCASTTLDDKLKKDADNSAEKREITPVSPALDSGLQNSCPNSSITNEASSTSTCDSTALSGNVKVNVNSVVKKSFSGSPNKDKTTPLNSVLKSQFKNTGSSLAKKGFLNTIDIITGLNSNLKRNTDTFEETILTHLIGKNTLVGSAVDNRVEINARSIAKKNFPNSINKDKTIPKCSTSNNKIAMNADSLPGKKFSDSINTDKTRLVSSTLNSTIGRNAGSLAKTNSLCSINKDEIVAGSPALDSKLKSTGDNLAKRNFPDLTNNAESRPALDSLAKKSCSDSVAPATSTLSDEIIQSQSDHWKKFCESIMKEISEDAIILKAIENKTIDWTIFTEPKLKLSKRDGLVSILASRMRKRPDTDPTRRRITLEEVPKMSHLDLFEVDEIILPPEIRAIVGYDLDSGSDKDSFGGNKYLKATPKMYIDLTGPEESVTFTNTPVRLTGNSDNLKQTEPPTLIVNVERNCTCNCIEKCGYCRSGANHTVVKKIPSSMMRVDEATSTTMDKKMEKNCTTLDISQKRISDSLEKSKLTNREGIVKKDLTIQVKNDAVHGDGSTVTCANLIDAEKEESITWSSIINMNVVNSGSMEKTNSTYLSIPAKRPASPFGIEESSHKRSCRAVPIPYVDLSKNLISLPATNVDDENRHPITIDKPPVVSKNDAPSDGNPKRMKEVSEDASTSGVDFSKNLSSTASIDNKHNGGSQDLSLLMKTSNTARDDVQRIEQCTSTGNKLPRISALPDEDDDKGEYEQNPSVDMQKLNLDVQKNQLFYASSDEEDLPLSVNISKNLISASSGAQTGELINTLSVPCVNKSKNLFVFGTSDALNEKNHCLHEMKSIDCQTSSEKHLLQEAEITIPSNTPKFYLKRYGRVKHSATTILDGDKSDIWKKKFNLKEVRVILHRMSLSECYKKKYIKPASKFMRYSPPKRKQPRREQKKVTETSENKTKDKYKKKVNSNKDGLKPWPLQDINPKVYHRKDTKSPFIFKDNKCEIDVKTDLKIMNPCVVLKRLEFDKDKKRIANSVLANIPGLNDLQMIRPSSVDRIVQVVQVPGVRNTTNVPIQNTQTSTQVTPHIQRIGQPRTEKPEASIPDSTSVASTTVSSTSTTSTTSESPTLINILSQQIIRPGTQGNCVGVRPRTSPLINILSQQIIKPATSVPPPTKVTSSVSSEVQVNSIPKVISGGDQILSQLINPVRTPAPTLKTLVNAPTTDHNRIVQFICKSSDGKLIPVTSFTSNKVVKVSMTQTVNTSVAGNTSADENFTKVTTQAPTPQKAKSETAENSDTLPKFQQAFGKPAYQNNIESAECVTSNSESANSDLEKSVNVVKTQPKNSSTSLNVQPVQGGVIYTRQVPVGQTINLIPPGRGQVFRIATSNAEQLSLVKDTVIHGKMSALLAAALQGKQQRATDTELDITSEENSQSGSRVAITTRPTLVQNARIVKPVLQIPSNVIRSTPQSNLSSTTLEQLREFDMVYKQVKERSSTSGAPTESSPQSDSNEPTQQISVTYLNQGQKINCAPVVVVSSYCNVQPAASPSLSVTSQGSSSPCVTPAPTLTLSKAAVVKNPKAKSVKSTTTHTTKASPIPKPQQKPQEDEHTTQRIFDILAEYAEQLRNSPDLNNKPAPRRRSNPPTNPNQNAKRKKSSSSKKTGHCSNSMASDGDLEDTHTVGSEDSSCGVVQISVQEEEQQLTTVSTSETSEASVSPKQLILTDSTPNQSRSLIIADSNVGEALKMSNTAVLVPGNYIMPVSMVKGGQQIAVVSGGSKILATVPARSGPNMLLFQSFLNQTRKHGLPTVKYSAVQPISGIARSLSTVAAQAPTTIPPTSQNLTAVTLAQTVALQKVNHLERTEINNFDTELLLTIAHPPDNKNNIPEQSQPEHRGISSSNENVQTIRMEDSILSTDSSLQKALVYEEKSLVNTSVATSVIAQSISIKEEKLSEEPSTTQTIMALNLNSSDSDKDTTIKVEGRVQSVLVATGTSNGPMLFNSPATYNKQTDSSHSISESNKDEYLRSEGKRNSSEAKSLQSTVYAYQGKIKRNQASSHRLDRELQQLSLQRKQAALERELRLQKSLSEECEDLGVDEPSTSDLFPEADLLFDSNHSPSFDQSSQDLVKRTPNTQEVKEETKTIGLFCDDEPMRTDFLFEPIEFQSAAVELDYKPRDMTNGQGSTSNESGFSCEDNTLLQTCTSMSDVTIPSPISPDPYTDNSPPPLNKCKYKYSNRKKIERSKQVENWPMEISSSEDTTGSTELTKSCSRSPEIYPGRRNRSLSCEEDDRDLIGFAIVERLPLKEDEECEELHCQEAADCPSGRGARRSVKKLCSCCNGSTKVARKRPASRPPTPFSHKKTVIAKKR